MSKFPIMTKASGAGVAIQLAYWFDPADTDREAILCIHGLTANLHCWDQIVQSLGNKHHFLAMDLRGRGHSDQPPTGYSLSAHAEDILAVLDDLKRKRITLIGHSLGACIGLAFAAACPERIERLILVDGGGQLPPEQLQRVLQALKPSLARLGNTFPTFEDYIAPLKNAPFFSPWTETLENYFRYEIIAVEGGVRSRMHPEHILEETENLTKADLAALYPRIACPTLILRATEGLFVKEDAVLPPDAAAFMVERIPQARLFDIAGTNHYSIVFYPQAERDRAIDNFLRQ